MKNKSVMSNFSACLLAVFVVFALAYIAVGEAANIKPTYEVAVTSGENGQITPATKSFKKGKNAVFTVKPFKGFKIDTITVDGEDIDLSQVKKPWNPHKYVFKKVDAAHTISATFKADMKISPSTYILKIGDEKKFYVTDSRGKKMPNATISWATENQNIATVSDNGLVTANGEGSITIFATYEGMIVEDVTPVIIDPLNIKVVSPFQRPEELFDINPSENATINFIHCDRKNPELVCPGAPEPGPIAAEFRFEGEDVLDSAQLFLDGADITSDSKLTTYSSVGGSSVIIRSISYGISDETLSDGIHEVTVNGTSKAGKVVSYTWSFIKK